MIELIFDLMHMIPLCMIGIITAYKYWGIDDIAPGYYIWAMMVGMIYTLFWHQKTKIKGAIAGVLSVGILGTWIVAGDEFREWLLQDHIRIVWTIIIGMCCFVIGQLALRNRKVDVAMSLAGLITLAVMLFGNIRPDKYAVLMVFFYIVLTIVKEIQCRWKKEGDIQIKAHTVYVMPYVIAVFIVMSLFKVPDKPYDWRLFKDMAKNVRVQYEVIMQSLNIKKTWDKKSAEVGFSEDSVLTGNIKNKKYKALEISTNSANRSGIYLGGKTFDTFDGRSWTKTDSTDMDMKNYDVLETVSAIVGYDGDNISDYIKSDYMYIDYVGVRTSHAFIPYKAFSYINEYKTFQKGGDISFTGRKQRFYKVRYYRLNMSYEGMIRLASSGYIQGDEELEKAKRLITLEGMSEYTIDGLKSYRKHVKEQYAKPVRVSEEVKEYLDDNLEGTESDYEKLKCFEKLLSNYKYSTNPGELPDSVKNEGDFLEYFLFDSKGGYCTHFATAFVLMARAEGIPARFVQGYSFILDDKNKEIMSDRAHAWSEAYIEGLGWIVFDPTPGFNRTVGWAVADKSNKADRVYEPDEDYAERYGREALQFDETDITNTDRRVIEPKQLYVPAVMVILFVIVFIIINHIYKEYLYKKMSAKEKLLLLQARNMKLLKNLGWQLETGETLEEYGHRLEGKVPKETIACMRMYEEILYADRNIEENIIEEFKANYDKLFRMFIRRKILRIKENDI